MTKPARKITLPTLAAAIAGLVAGTTALSSCGKDTGAAAGMQQNGCNGPNGCKGQASCSGPNGCDGHGTKGAETKAADKKG